MFGNGEKIWTAVVSQMGNKDDARSHWPGALIILCMNIAVDTHLHIFQRKSQRDSLKSRIELNTSLGRRGFFAFALFLSHYVVVVIFSFEFQYNLIREWKYLLFFYHTQGLSGQLL